MNLHQFSRHDGTLTDELLQEIGRLRITAWEADGGRSLLGPTSGNVWLDIHDDHAMHFAFLLDGRVIAAARTCVHQQLIDVPDPQILGDLPKKGNFPAAFMNRLVVHRDFRRNGLASEMDEARLQWARSMGVGFLFVTTHSNLRISVLEKRGFSRLGDSKFRHVSWQAETILLKALA